MSHAPCNQHAHCVWSGRHWPLGLACHPASWCYDRQFSTELFGAESCGPSFAAQGQARAESGGAQGPSETSRHPSTRAVSTGKDGAAVKAARGDGDPGRPPPSPAASFPRQL